MSDQSAHDSFSGCLLRLFWLLGGNALLALLGLQILFSAAPVFSRVDAFYWAVVVLILVARYADVHVFQGTRVEGQAPRFSDWGRHALVLVALAGILWIALHLAVHFLIQVRPAV